MRRSKFAILSIISLISVGVLAACDTIEGAGQDIQGAGQAISETADEAED